MLSALLEWPTERAAASEPEEWDLDDEVEALHACMEQAHSADDADSSQHGEGSDVGLQQAIAASLAPSVTAECKRQGGTDSRCRLIALPEELQCRCLRHLPVSTLLGPMTLVSKHLAALASREARDRSRCMLLDALADGFNADAASEASSSTNGGAASSDSGGASAADGGVVEREFPERAKLVAVSSRLEQELSAFAANNYRELAKRSRTLCWNLRDPKNPDLRARLLGGQLEPAALVRLTGKELASTGLQQERREWQKKRLLCAIKPKPELGFLTDLYRCDNCGCGKARVHRVIRAGTMAVDRARTYATCVDCSARWEV